MMVACPEVLKLQLSTQSSHSYYSLWLDASCLPVPSLSLTVTLEGGYQDLLKLSWRSQEADLLGHIRELPGLLELEGSRCLNPGWMCASSSLLSGQESAP
ncbi:uncharacterized protein LOC103162924 isoform X1 [Cricetulus griseus]|uniref:uncharacterized protein LOC103162924 isoform X1 n=1 Tax=Cricetulus griseus TaxID=10029 RepID=UPI0004542D06|nr:uncharacterized protein LOC103162924 isoform X1 [Cricetulus griseus]